MSPLFQLKARDLMQKDVVTLPADAPIREAVSLLEEYRISGAPVLDESGQVIGVLSAADIVQSAHLADDRIAERPGDWYLANPLDEYREDDYGWDEADLDDIVGYSPDVAGRETARAWMNPRVISVSADASIEDVCRVMADERIHRVLVLEGDRMQGILTTFDVVTAVANGAGDERPRARGHARGRVKAGSRRRLRR